MDTTARWTAILLLLMAATSSCRGVTSHSSTEASSSTTPTIKSHSITEDLEKTHVLGPEDEDEDILEVLGTTRQPHVSVQLPTVGPDTDDDDDDDDTADLVPPAAPTEKPAKFGLLIINIIHSLRDPQIRTQTTAQPEDSMDSTDNHMSNHDLQTSNFVYPPFYQRFYPYYSRPYAFNSPYFSSYPSNSYYNWPRYSRENSLAHLF